MLIIVLFIIRLLCREVQDANTQPAYRLAKAPSIRPWLGTSRCPLHQSSRIIDNDKRNVKTNHVTPATAPAVRPTKLDQPTLIHGAIVVKTVSVASAIPPSTTVDEKPCVEERLRRFRTFTLPTKQLGNLTLKSQSNVSTNRPVDWAALDPFIANASASRDEQSATVHEHATNFASSTSVYDDQQLYNNHGIPSVTMDSVDKLSVSVPGKLIPPLSAHDEAPMGHQHKALDSDGESADGTLASERFVSDIKLLAIDEPVLVDALVSEHASVISDAISRCTTEDCIDELLLQILEHVVKKRRQLRLSLKHKIRTNDLLPENHQELGDKDSELWSMGNDQFKLRAERRSDHAAHQDERSSTSTLLDDVRLSVNETSNASVVGHAAMLAAGDPARGERCCYGSYEGDKACAHSFPDHLDDKICNSANNPPVEPMFLDKRRAMESTNLQPTSLESSSLIVNDEFNGEISFGTKLKLDETSSMRCENACRPDTKVMSSGKMVMLILIVSAYCALIFFGWEIQCTAARLTSFLRFLVALRLFVFKFVASLLGFDQGRVKRGFDFDEGDYTEEELAWICADGGAARQASLDEQQFKTDRATDEDHILGTASQTCASRPTSIGAAKLAHFRACKEHDRMVEASRRSG